MDRVSLVPALPGERPVVAFRAQKRQMSNVVQFPRRAAGTTFPATLRFALDRQILAIEKAISALERLLKGISVALRLLPEGAARQRLETESRLLLAKIAEAQSALELLKPSLDPRLDPLDISSQASPSESIGIQAATTDDLITS
jgi:hypothetical protein